MWDDGYDHGGMMDGAWGAWWLVLLLSVLLVGAVVLVVLQRSGASAASHPPSQPRPQPPGEPPASPRPDDEASRILRERLARGEIDEAEYDRRRRALGDG